MKKLIPMLMLLLCFSIISCVDDKPPPTPSPNIKTDLPTSITDPVIVKTDEVKKVIKKVEKKNWKVRHFADSFGDPTKNRYIESSSVGVFSNSATKNSPLYVDIMVISDEYIGIFLFEYSRRRPATYFIGNNGRVLMKNSYGEKHKITYISKWGQSGGLSIRNGEAIRFLKRSVGLVKFVIYDEHSSQYHFSINANGFTAAYNMMKR